MMKRLLLLVAALIAAAILAPARAEDAEPVMQAGRAPMVCALPCAPGA